MAKYDTAEIRRAAMTIRRSRDHLNATVVKGLRRVEAELEGEFLGQAADALTNRLESMDADARRIEEKLDTLSGMLMKFANDMDAADQKLASQM